MFGANLVILVQICGELSRRHAEFASILSENGQNDLEGQSQWPPFYIPAESIQGYMFGANLVILAQICDELLHGQAEFPRILSQNSQNDFVGQGQWPPFWIPAENIPGCMFGANLVVPAQTCDALFCGQWKVYGQTDGRTDRQTDRRRQRQNPFGLIGQEVKTITLTLKIYRIIHGHRQWTICVLTRELFWCLFPEFLSNEGNKQQNNSWGAHKEFIKRVYT